MRRENCIEGLIRQQADLDIGPVEEKIKKVRGEQKDDIL